MLGLLRRSSGGAGRVRAAFRLYDGGLAVQLGTRLAALAA
jgi:hypothetical protein